MAIHKGLLSPLVRKSIGDITFAVWKGIPVAKQKITRYSGKFTDAQKAQQGRMKALVEMGRTSVIALRIGFASLAQGKTEFNVFVSKNTPNVTGAPDLTAVVNLPQLVFSQGSLALAAGVANLAIAGSTLSVDWTPPAAGDIDENDSVCLLAMNGSKSLVLSIEEDFQKSAGTGEVVFPFAPEPGDELHMWLFTYNADSGNVGETQYVGSVNA